MALKILAKIKGEMIMICRSMPWLLVLAFGFVSFSPAPGLAAEDEKTAVSRGDAAGKTPVEWNAQVSVGVLPSADLHGIPGNVGITDYRMRIGRNIRLNERLTLSLGGGYGLKHVDTSSAAALPQDLHSLFIEAGASYRISDRSFASIKLYPGLYSDFKDLGADDLRVPSLLVGGYSFDYGLTVVGGFIYRYGYYASQLIPALGFIYQPDDHWRIDLIAPRPGVTYLASRQLQLFVAGDFASDEYEIKDRSFGAKAIRYNDYKAMAGVYYLPTPSVKISTFVGYAFERKFAFFNGTRLEPDLRMDDVPFLKISLDVGW